MASKETFLIAGHMIAERHRYLYSVLKKYEALSNKCLNVDRRGFSKLASTSCQSKNSKQERTDDDNTLSSPSNENIVILGTGIAGLSSAHYLLSKTSADHNDTQLAPTILLLDQHGSVAQGTSRKNGNLLCPSLSHAWTSKPILFGKDAIFFNFFNVLLKKENDAMPSPISFCWRVMIDKGVWKFGFHFLLQRLWAITPSTQQRGEDAIRKLAEYSLECFDDENDELMQNIDYNRGDNHGTKTQKDKEADNGDSSGDIAKFCRGLEREMIEKHGDRVSFRFNETVVGFETRGDLITSVVTRNGQIILYFSESEYSFFEFGLKTCGTHARFYTTKGHERITYAKQILVATGTESGKVLEEIGVKCPIFPVKGYLVTFTSSRHVPYNCELSSKTFVSPMGNGTYRLSGFADFVVSADEQENTLTAGSKRIAGLIQVAKQEFPDMQVVDIDFGYRPVSPDDIPLIGQTSKYKNLYLCTGHGSKGWTMGPGSGKLVADLMLNRLGDIDPLSYSPKRFDLSFMLNGIFSKECVQKDEN